MLRHLLGLGRWRTLRNWRKGSATYTKWQEKDIRFIWSANQLCLSLYKTVAFRLSLGNSSDQKLTVTLEVYRRNVTWFLTWGFHSSRALLYLADNHLYSGSGSGVSWPKILRILLSLSISGAPKLFFCSRRPITIILDWFACRKCKFLSTFYTKPPDGRFDGQ